MVSLSCGLVNAIETTSTTAVDWDNRIALQQMWKNEEKGWKVEVEWKDTPFGIGLFAKQDIGAGTTLRRGVTGCNLKQFTSVEEIEAFCQSGVHPNEYDARLRYVSDYLWGFTTQGTNPGGYPPKDQSQDEKYRFYGMWIPGNGLNHDAHPNTVYRTSPDGIDLVALVDVSSGSELFDDYRRHGQAPQWLLDFGNNYNVSLNFSECNDFVKSPS